MITNYFTCFLLSGLFIFSAPASVNPYQEKIIQLKQHQEAETVSFTQGPIASATLFTNSPERYLIVTFKREKEREYLFQKVSQELWLSLKSSSSPIKSYHSLLAKRKEHQVSLASKSESSFTRL
jgi:hypothetical protein